MKKDAIRKQSEIAINHNVCLIEWDEWDESFLKNLMRFRIRFERSIKLNKLQICSSNHFKMGADGIWYTKKEARLAGWQNMTKTTPTSKWHIFQKFFFRPIYIFPLSFYKTKNKFYYLFLTVKVPTLRFFPVSIMIC